MMPWPGSISTCTDAAAGTPAVREWSPGTSRPGATRIHVLAGPDALDAFSPGPRLTPVDSLPPRPDRRTLVTLIRRVREAARRIRRDRVELVVSDGDLPGVLAARLCGVPVIAVGHGLVFARCARPSGLPRRRWWRERLKAGLSSLGAHVHVAVSFVPVRPLVPRTVVARPGVGVDGPSERGSDVLCYFRDGNGSAAVREVVAAGHRAVVFGRLEPPVAAARVRPLDREGFAAALRGARAVVASAGSQLIAECTALGIPLFAVHHPDDDEQTLNVAMLRAAGLGDGGALGPALAPRLRRFLAAFPTPVVVHWSAPDVTEATADAVDHLLATRAREVA